MSGGATKCILLIWTEHSRRCNLDAVSRMAKIEGLSIQLGGGMRDQESVTKALLGIKKNNYWNACLYRSQMGRRWLRNGPEKIVVGIDAKDGRVATKDGLKPLTFWLLELAQEMASLGVRWIIHPMWLQMGQWKDRHLHSSPLRGSSIKILASGGAPVDVEELGAFPTPPILRGHHQTCPIRRNYYFPSF